MPSLTYLLSFAALSAVSCAAPFPQESSSAATASATATSTSATVKCLTDAQASQVAQNFGDVISSYTPGQADAVLAPNITDTTESVNTIIDGGGTSPNALLSPLYTNRDDFATGQQTQPVFPYEQLNMWYSCQEVIVRWESPDPASGQPTKATEEPVVGIAVLHVIYNDASTEPESQWLIDQIYSEFDSGAFLVDLGIFTPNGTLGPPAKS